MENDAGVDVASVRDRPRENCEDSVWDIPDDVEEGERGSGIIPETPSKSFLQLPEMMPQTSSTLTETRTQEPACEQTSSLSLALPSSHPPTRLTEKKRNSNVARKAAPPTRPGWRGAYSLAF